ncbi:MAG: protein ligase [Firmicutes bacterium]|nr:protein ligase [Bacillota bacterium]
MQIVVYNDIEQRSPQAQLNLDEQLLQAAAKGDVGPTWRLWQDGQALVVTRKETHLPHFHSASVSLHRQGWPVVVRRSGGSTLPHTAEMLQLSLILPRGLIVVERIAQLYAWLAAPLVGLLETYGIQVGFGEVKGAFCDGSYNLVASGHKIAGTAQRWIGGLAGVPSRQGAVLAHATLFVKGQMRAPTQAVNTFYALAGGQPHYEERAVTTMETMLQKEVQMEEVRQKLLSILERGDLVDAYGNL